MRDQRAFSSVLLVLGAAVLVSCGSPPNAAPDLAMRIRFGLGEPQRLGEEVDRVVIDVFIDGRAEPETSVYTIAELPDLDGDGRPEWESPALPVDVPVRIRIRGEVLGDTAFIGHVGPLRFGAGERRSVEPVMYPVDQMVTPPDASMRGRFFHSATTLADGRVLVAGGYDDATIATCPPRVREGARCMRLRATNEAWLFDPSTGRFHAVMNGMLQARAGHTATLLLDGRVLVAGGANTAILVFEPQGPTEAPTGYALTGGPLDEAGNDASRATFELFDPGTDGGDASAGSFIGAADNPSAPGRLDRGRVFAAAARVPGTHRVLIAGGQGVPDASTTYTIFDPERAGGYGVLETDGNSLSVARLLATAVSMDDRVSGSIWLFGGAGARSDADLAEVWQQGTTDPNGASRPATEPPLLFPRQAADTPASHPEWSLLAPLAARVGDTHILVAGWYGPLCELGASASVFAGGANPREPCAFEGTRNFTVNVTTGLAALTSTAHPHAFGASATLDDGRVLLSGGISSLAWNATNGTELFTGSVDAMGAAERDDASIQLGHGRFWHSASSLWDSGVLFFGGIRLSDDLMEISFAPPEMIYFSR